MHNTTVLLSRIITLELYRFKYISYSSGVLPNVWSPSLSMKEYVKELRPLLLYKFKQYIKLIYRYIVLFLFQHAVYLKIARQLVSPTRCGGTYSRHGNAFVHYYCCLERQGNILTSYLLLLHQTQSRRTVAPHYFNSYYFMHRLRMAKRSLHLWGRPRAAVLSSYITLLLIFRIIVAILACIMCISMHSNIQMAFRREHSYDYALTIFDSN